MGPLGFVPEVGAKPQNEAREPPPWTERRPNDESRDSPRQSCHLACSPKLVREYMREALKQKNFATGISEVY